jgi:hypothetical protein
MMYRNVVPFSALPPLDGSHAPLDWLGAIMYASGIGYRPIPVYADHNAIGGWRPAQAVTSLLAPVAEKLINSTTAETVVSDDLPLLLPAGFIFPGDKFAVALSAAKTVSTGTTTFRIRYGSSATMASNAVIWSSGALANTQTHFGFKIDIKHLSDYKVRQMGNGSVVDPFSGGTVGGPSSITVHDPWTTVGRLYLTAQHSAGGDSMEIFDSTVHLITGYEQNGDEV